MRRIMIESKPVTRLCIALFIGTCVASCGGDIIFEEEPTDDGVARDGLTMRFVVAPEDSLTAARLGWPGRGIPQAEVWLEREGADHRIGSKIRGVSDDNGVIAFETLIEGRYRVNALRVLHDDEVLRLPEERSNLRAFGGAMKAGLGEFELVLEPNRDGLVISEVSATDKAGVSYIWFGYVELYNNSDAVIYLDGHLLGRFHAPPRGGFDTSCASRMAYSDDPAGVWARLFQKFPGTGTQYPLAPGATAVVAQDAIDHSVVDPDFFDLTNAAFEFRTPSDPDNPTVPDMIDYGTRASAGNGIQLIPGSISPPFLAAPVEIDALPRARVFSPLVDDEFVQIPRASVQDVWTWINGDPTTPTEICSRATSTVFDRMTYDFRHDNMSSHLFSQHRRLIGTTSSGRSILMDTGTSSVDLIEGPRTPGFQF